MRAAFSSFSKSCAYLLGLIYLSSPHTFILALDENDLLEPIDEPESEEEESLEEDLLLPDVNSPDKSLSYGDVIEPLTSTGLDDLIGVLAVDPNDSLNFANALDQFANRKGSCPCALFISYLFSNNFLFVVIHLEIDSNDKPITKISQLDLDALVVLSKKCDLGLLSTLSELNLPLVIDLDSGFCTLYSGSLVSIRF